MNSQALIRSWIEGNVEDLSPETRRAIPLIARGFATEEQMAAVGGDLVVAIKSSPNLFHQRFGTGGPLDDEDEKRVKDDNTIPWVLSDETVDRDGDIIRVKGWNLKAYKKSPVVLSGHGRDVIDGDEPIGKMLNVRKGEGRGGKPALVGDVRFAVDESERAARKFRLAAGGYLKSGSVGFIPHDTRHIESEEERSELGLGRFGVVFEKQDLLEFSIVGVPSNPNALQNGIKRGVITEADADWFAAATDPTEKEAEKYIRRRSREFVAMTNEAPASVTTSNSGNVFTLSYADPLEDVLKEHSAATKMLARSITDLGSCIRDLKQAPAASDPDAENQSRSEDGFTDEEKESLEEAKKLLDTLLSKDKE